MSDYFNITNVSKVLENKVTSMNRSLNVTFWFSFNYKAKDIETNKLEASLWAPLIDIFRRFLDVLIMK